MEPYYNKSQFDTSICGKPCAYTILPPSLDPTIPANSTVTDSMDTMSLPHPDSMDTMVDSVLIPAALGAVAGLLFAMMLILAFYVSYMRKR